MSNGIAVSIVPGELRMLIARTNGAVQPLHQLVAELPEGAVHAGLRAPNLAAPETIAEVLRGLVDEAEAGRERGGIVSVLIPDAAVRMALVPLEGAAPSRAEGESMARWALRDLLPVEPDSARVSWSVVEEESTEPAGKWLLVIGADATVVQEYESVVEAVGWTPGRVVPLTLALAVGAGADEDTDPGMARIVLSGVGAQIACLVEAGGVPRLHRSWRGAAPDLALELPNIQRYAEQRLDLSIDEAVIAGPDGWRQKTAIACEALGWRVHVCSSWSAHIGAVRP